MLTIHKQFLKHFSNYKRLHKHINVREIFLKLDTRNSSDLYSFSLRQASPSKDTSNGSYKTSNLQNFAIVF